MHVTTLNALELEQALVAAAPITVLSECGQTILHLEGAVRSRLSGEKLTIEMCGDVHTVASGGELERKASSIRLEFRHQSFVAENGSAFAVGTLRQLRLSRPPGIQSIAKNSRIRSSCPPGVQVLLPLFKILAQHEKTPDLRKVKSGTLEVVEDGLVVRLNAESSPTDDVDHQEAAQHAERGRSETRRTAATPRGYASHNEQRPSPPRGLYSIVDAGVERCKTPSNLRIPLSDAAVTAESPS